MSGQGGRIYLVREGGVWKVDAWRAWVEGEERFRRMEERVR